MLLIQKKRAGDLDIVVLNGNDWERMTMKMMNDKEFRQKCREISYASIEDYMRDRQYLVSTRKEDVDVLKTAALLYIAANMPKPKDLD